MKTIVSFLAIAALTAACQTPAYASSAKQPTPEATQPAPKRYSLDAETIGALQRYIEQSAILYSVKCAENGTMWFCNAAPLAEAIRKNAQEIPNAKPVADKPASK